MQFPHHPIVIVQLTLAIIFNTLVHRHIFSNVLCGTSWPRISSRFCFPGRLQPLLQKTAVVEGTAHAMNTQTLLQRQGVVPQTGPAKVRQIARLNSTVTPYCRKQHTFP